MYETDAIQIHHLIYVYIILFLIPLFIYMFFGNYSQDAGEDNLFNIS